MRGEAELQREQGARLKRGVSRTVTYFPYRDGIIKVGAYYGRAI